LGNLPPLSSPPLLAIKGFFLWMRIWGIRGPFFPSAVLTFTFGDDSSTPPRYCRSWFLFSSEGVQIFLFSLRFNYVFSPGLKAPGEFLSEATTVFLLNFACGAPLFPPHRVFALSCLAFLLGNRPGSCMETPDLRHKADDPPQLFHMKRRVLP